MPGPALRWGDVVGGMARENEDHALETSPRPEVEKHRWITFTKCAGVRMSRADPPIEGYGYNFIPPRGK